eukprot:367250-Rhodomonas_salina.1
MSTYERPCAVLPELNVRGVALIVHDQRDFVLFQGHVEISLEQRAVCRRQSHGVDVPEHVERRKRGRVPARSGSVETYGCIVKVRVRVLLHCRIRMRFLERAFQALLLLQRCSFQLLHAFARHHGRWWGWGVLS